MTKRCLLLFTAVVFGWNGYAQDTPTDTIDVVLLGTFHYGATTDANSTDFPDLFTEKRQRELDQLTNALSELTVDKVFIERQEKYQGKYDSLYKAYLENELTDTVVLRPEEIQIGFRLAAQSNLEKVYCVDVKLPLPYDKLNQFEATFGEKEASFFAESAYPFTDTSRQLNLAAQTLSHYYVKLNDEYHRQARLYDFIHYAMSYVAPGDFTGPEFTGIWYERNLKIFSKILNSLTKEDKTIVVLFGSSHTDVLRQFFESHPLFEMVELEDVLTNKSPIRPDGKLNR